MDDQDEERAKERIGLKLVLAEFALQLDAFEARIRDRPTRPNSAPSDAASVNRGFANQIVAVEKYPTG
jgi:hypothetical protein